MQFHEIARQFFTAHAPSISAGEFPSGFPTIPIINSDCADAASRRGSRAFCHRDSSVYKNSSSSARSRSNLSCKPHQNADTSFRWSRTGL